MAYGALINHTGALSGWYLGLLAMEDWTFIFLARGHLMLHAMNVVAYM